MSIEERLAAAERRIAQLERRLGPGDYMNPTFVPAPLAPFQDIHRCNCPPGAACGNVACPMRPRVTCGVDPKFTGWATQGT